MTEIKQHYLMWGKYTSNDSESPDILEFKVIDFNIFNTEYSKNVKIKQRIENSWKEIILPLKSHTSLNSALLYLWVKERKAKQIKKGKRIFLKTWLGLSKNGNVIRRYKMEFIIPL
jgi:hypothetical protein